jgi:hypothetical protein
MTAAKRTQSTRSRRAASKASEIAPGVFVGGWNDAVVFEGARFCVLDQVPEDDLPAEAHRTIYDEAKDAAIRESLDEVAALAQKARSQGTPVLFFCGHGVRRGPLAAAWYLHRAEGIPLDAAYQRIRAVRPKIEHVSEWVGNWQVLSEGASRPAGTPRS